MSKGVGQDMHLIASATGELIDTIKAEDRFSIRRKGQVENDTYWSPPIKMQGRFVKAMEREDEIIDMLKDSPAIYLALNKMKKYLQINDNTLMKNGKKYKTSDLAEDLNICRQTASLYIKKFKDKNIIAELDKGKKGKFLVINPNYYLAGDSVPAKTLKLFEKQ